MAPDTYDQVHADLATSEGMREFPPPPADVRRPETFPPGGRPGRGPVLSGPDA
jgi:hypothetical protein